MSRSPAAKPAFDPSSIPEIPENVSVSHMDPWRKRIDEIDRQLLLLLNERAYCANAIGSIKKELGMPIYVPSREEEVLRNVCAANYGPLPNEAVRRLFERVIDEIRSLERRTFQPPPPQQDEPSII